MLYHHDTVRDYDTAAKDAAAHARRKLDALIDRGRGRASAVIDQVMSTRPVDRLVRGAALDFTPANNGLELGLGDTRERLHDHALTQAASRVGLPQAYVSHLQDEEHQSS